MLFFILNIKETEPDEENTEIPHSHFCLPSRCGAWVSLGSRCGMSPWSWPPPPLADPPGPGHRASWTGPSLWHNQRLETQPNLGLFQGVMIWSTPTCFGLLLTLLCICENKVTISDITVSFMTTWDSMTQTKSSFLCIRHVLTYPDWQVLRWRSVLWQPRRWHLAEGWTSDDTRRSSVPWWKIEL